MHTGRRFMYWAFLCATSLIAMSAAAGTYRDVECKDSSEYAYCQNLNISISFGVVVAALALGMMVALRLLKENLKLIAEGVASVVAVVLYAVSVAYTTAPNAPGAYIGNLYYSTWFSFIISVVLLLDCFRETRFGGEATSVEVADKAEEQA